MKSVIIIAMIIGIIIVTGIFVVLQYQKQYQIQLLENRFHEIVNQVHNGEYSPIYVECEQEVNQYGSGLISAIEYRTNVLDCYSTKLESLTAEIENINQQLSKIKEDLK